MATSKKKKSTLNRPKNPMPANVRKALTDRGLMEAYKARPPYQQNDYLGWIARAKLEATRQKRLDQMLAELKGGKQYMNMAWLGRSSSALAARAKGGKKSPRTK